MKEISFKFGKILVDDEDYFRVSRVTWSLSGKVGEEIITGAGTTIGRFILNYNGPNVVDHKDTDIFNNQKLNLRIVTQAQNQMNRKTLNGDFRGIDYLTKRNKWRARIKVNYKEKFLGEYYTKKAAAKAYDVAAKKYFGEFAQLNFPCGAWDGKG